MGRGLFRILRFIVVRSGAFGVLGCTVFKASGIWVFFGLLLFIGLLDELS